MRYHRQRRNRFRSGDKSFKRINSQELRMSGSVNSVNSHQRKSFGRNGNNPEKLLEKYNSLAKEASSNGDKILSENYYQYADHFLRVIENRNSSQNNTQNNSKTNLNNSTIEKSLDDKVVLKDEKKPSSDEHNRKEI